VGDYHVLFDTMGWARNTLLQVWGPSGCTPEMGTAALWHIESKRELVLSTGATSIPPEFESLHKIRLQELSRNACVWFTCYTLTEPIVINLSSMQEV
jgi:hypothetical protein